MSIKQQHRARHADGYGFEFQCTVMRLNKKNVLVNSLFSTVQLLMNMLGEILLIQICV